MRLKGLRNKILFSMVMLLVLLGLSTALVNRVILDKVLKKEFENEGLSHARIIASISLVDILTQNTGRLNKLLSDEKASNKKIAYIFITDSSNRIITHTFQKGFPVDLREANSLPSGRDFNIQPLDTQMGYIYDIVVPIFLAKSLIGRVRLGIFQKGMQETTTVINFIILSTTLFTVIAGIFLAHRISFLITRPISSLAGAVESIRRGDFSAKIDVKNKDEIGLLASAFNEMSSRLNTMVEEMKQLALVKERNRIAFDLHDCCAQDLANIIKRTELCQKLFKIDPVKASEELDALRENTKDALDRTRQVIFDLKSPLDNDFALLDKLIPFIKEYERSSNIVVRLGPAHSVNNILPIKAREIFYIIKEAFNNIAKHSLAKNVALKIDAAGGNRLIINIKDDGRGFDIKESESAASGQRKYGLMSMRERASSLGGTFNIYTIPNQGTEISVDIPL